MLIIPSVDEAITLYEHIQDVKVTSFIQPADREKTYKELSYTALRSLILNPNYAPIQVRQNALATFIARANTSERLNTLVSNAKLLQVLYESLAHHSTADNILYGKASKVRATANYRVTKNAQTPVFDTWDKLYIENIYKLSQWLSSFSEPYHVDRIKPLAKGGEHTPDNLQILPAERNISKRDKYDGL